VFILTNKKACLSGATTLETEEKEMTKLFLIGWLMGFLMPVLAIAQSDFDGTWKIDLNKAVMPNDSEVFLLQNGSYQCKKCVPGINVKADAQDHSVSGSGLLERVASIVSCRVFCRASSPVRS
jgi:hypothetical protein